jgi:c-di-AMP phosphodiesterase-like protein
MTLDSRTPESLRRSKALTDEMLEWMRGKGKTIIIIHDNPDPDCLASAMALRHLFAMKLRGKRGQATFCDYQKY